MMKHSTFTRPLFIATWLLAPFFINAQQEVMDDPYQPSLAKNQLRSPAFHLSNGV